MPRTAPSQRRSWRALTVIIALAGVALGLAAPTTASAQPTARSAARYAVNRPLCDDPASTGAVRCLALQRVTVAQGTPDSYRYYPSANGAGPGGGVTPAQLASAYDFNPAVSRRNQVVALIDWFDDPNVLRDLNHFDSHYHLRRETTASFRKVNQRGRAKPLPRRHHATSAEIALDVEAVRGVCHTCRILLVEADGPQPGQLAAAVDTAARLHATEISNSYGGPEVRTSKSVRNAYRHPGIVITASAGDNGWRDFDWVDSGRPSSGRALFPATSPNVVAVGGTTLMLSHNHRASETVWNDNGPSDSWAAARNRRLGASGGGCSRLYGAPAWQRAYRGYSAAGCHGKRLANDIAAIADPRTGYAVYDTYGEHGWLVVGGTSLAAPVVAAMYALAGGSGGSAFPAASLYVNGTHRASSLFDVTSGGSAFCGGASTTACAQATSSYTKGRTNNPNAIGVGTLDCSFPGSSTAVVTRAPALSSQCNAVPGFDGPSGLGSPANESAFTHTNAAVWMTHPRTRHAHRSDFTAHSRAAVHGARVVSYTWQWGDGHMSRTRSAHATHRYRHAGKRTVTLTVTDSLHQIVIKRYVVSVR